MQKNKQALKSVLSVVISFSLAVVMALGVAFTPSISVKATTDLIETISEGETWRDSWSSLIPSKSLYLDIDETKFYNITVTDHNQTGIFIIEVLDSTTEQYLGYIIANEGDIVSSYTSKEMFLIKDHKYELTCHYIDSNDLYSTLDADISIEFNNNAIKLEQLPNCLLSSSNLMVSFTENDNLLWVKYKTTTAGDYSLNFNDLHAFVSVFNSTTGEEIYSDIDTEYISDYYNLTWSVRDKLVFNLNAETEYYFLITSYEESQSKLSMTKNDKTVKNIEVNDAIYAINSFWRLDDIDFACFDYKITYTDNTSKIIEDFSSVYESGYELPEIEFLGEEVSINGEWYLYGGNQPIASTYNGVTTNKYIYIESLSDYCSTLNPTRENVNCIIEYEDLEDKIYFWRIKVSTSGLYSIWRYNSDDFDTNFDYYSISFVDEKNNIIEYDDINEGWPLVANTEYVLAFNCCYNQNHQNNDIIFWLHKEYDLSGWRSDANGWWYQNADGSYPASAWLNDGGVWYYFNSSGYMVTGWQSIGGAWYYFNGSGAMVTGWLNDGGTWYYFNGSGAMVTGWLNDGGTWYYFNGSGAMVTGWLNDGGTWYYFNGSGAMVTGWLNDGGTWYYFNGSGAMATGWQVIGGTWYYFYGSGAMAANCYIDGCWLNASGAWA